MRRSVALLVVALLALPAAATAQEPGAQPPARSLHLTVTELTGVIGPGARSAAGTDADTRPPTVEIDERVTVRALVDNDGAVAIDDIRVVVEVFDAIEPDRAALVTALDGGAPGLLVHADNEPVSGGSLGPGGIAGVEVVVEADDADWAADGGIHPLRVSVVHGTEVLDRVTTAVVRIAETPEDPLLTTVVWPLDDEPWRRAGGTYPLGIDTPIRAGGRLERLLAAAEAHPGSGLLLAPAPHLLEDLRDRADGFRRRVVSVDDDVEVMAVAPESDTARRSSAFLQRVRDLAGMLPHAPVVGPYADVDLAGLAAAADDDETLVVLATSAVREGRRRLADLVQRPPDAATFLATVPLDSRTLDLVAGEHVLLPADPAVDRDGVARGDGDPLRSLRAASGRGFTATVADPALSQLVARPDVDHGPAVATQRVLVETALRWGQPPRAGDRTLLVMPPPGWSPPDRFPRLLLDALTDATWLELTTPAVQAASRAAPDLATLPGTGVEPLSDDLAAALTDTVTSLDTLYATLPDDAGASGRIAGRDYAELSDQLLRAPSVWLRDDTLRATNLVDDVRTAVEQTFGAVEVPGASRITLTSDTGTIPVTLHRPEDGTPLEVRVEVESQGRLAWPDGRLSAPILLAAGDTETVSFATRALARGTFPVSVRVTDTNGSRVLERATLLVRATTISTPALAITGGTALLLVVVGLFRRRPRHTRRPRLEVVG